MSNRDQFGFVVLGPCVAIMPAHAANPFKNILATQAAAEGSGASKGPAVKIYFNQDTFQQEVAARSKTGRIEIHASRSDCMAALSVEAKLTAGGAPCG
ncbi:MAG: hypothetical protein WA821_22390 [Anaerolineales bacterium]